MKYRKIFALLLAAATLFSLAACGETAAGPEATPDPALDESAATVSGWALSPSMYEAGSPGTISITVKMTRLATTRLAASETSRRRR